MNKSELIQVLSEKSDITPELARSVVETMIGKMKQQLMDGGRIEIRGFGSFEMREYGAYKGRNPQTGESVEVKPKRRSLHNQHAAKGFSLFLVLKAYFYVFKLFFAQLKSIFHNFSMQFFLILDPILTQKSDLCFYACFM